MKLGFLLFDYFPFGGLQRDCLRIAERCAERGHHVTIFTRTWQGEQPRNVRVELFGLQGWTNVARNRHWLRQLAQRLSALALDGVIGFNKLPGLDVYYGSDPCYVAKIARLKPSWYRWLPRFRHFAALERAVFERGRPTEILVLTTHEIAAYQNFYGTERKRFHVLPPGIERRSFTSLEQTEARRDIRAEHGWASDERLLLLVGSGFRVKGLDRAIRSLASLPEDLRSKTRLVVIGQNRATEFAMLARRLQVQARVSFLGGRSDVFRWLLAADLLVHPAYSEAAGMILLEALTAGLPVLTTDTCGYASHVLDAGAGRVLASPFQQHECDRAVEEMLRRDPGAWRAGALQYSEKNDLYSCHDRAADIIEETIGRKGNDRA